MCKKVDGGHKKEGTSVTMLPSWMLPHIGQDIWTVFCVESRVERTGRLFLLIFLLLTDSVKGMEWIVPTYPVTTPYVNSMKCWTCVDGAENNYHCNRWAPDVWCPQGTKYCYTFHRMSGNESSLVVKKCATEGQCTVKSVGCRDFGGTNTIRECISCCEGNVCNPEVPRNASDAIFATITPLNSAKRIQPFLWTVLACLLVFYHYRLYS
ncbi:ly6/PLAUR domain-containing protein 6-like [Branchiostoma floridae x Branchiostoma japonicum]